MEACELGTWFISTLIMIIGSSTVFLVQRFVSQLFNYAFEFFIFYVPTIVMTAVYLIYKSRTGAA